MQRQNICLTIVFILILLLPALDSVFHFSPVKDLFEKRIPYELPQFSFSRDYSKNFEKFFNDNYGFRKTLISINSKMTDKIFDESPDVRAVIGRGGWLYFDNHNSLLDAVGKAQISDELVERGVESFYHNWQEMRAKNIDYLLVIAADKSTIYPEFLPDYMKQKAPHRIDKFLTLLKKKYPDFPVIDLRPILLEAKKREIIYHQTDTHWNRRGAHPAYVEIARKLGFKPHLRSDFINKEDELVRGDISDIMNSNSMNVNYDLQPKYKPAHNYVFPTPPILKNFHRPYFVVNENKNLPVIFVYKDSYFGDLIDLISEHFSTAYYINEFPCDLNWETIKKFHPNVVIQQFWEGRIEVVLNQCQ
ncbi:MAG: hypothetical protein A2887_05200 [Alphaproteobacteria bacterium RIFCSPLOWO2_01_FULL_40_26]|nr:MAG: hypothetical protein A3D15_05155 [Alphaproteobacteria bacterium RIFCSPHIGHO2_02_FULL_40_34]OFW88034.1 MAG: hypothetical protein A2794_03995 [Alphaproteobacteria bacterium RIFCSPHIGHO2_01_FULL_40_8]OFW95353.1 MAG: hypothetical protein A2887_05200 [Alphaproteobacteria bacterium RIFCSPLOWO2_01_FULL_40_26]OFX09128.1 MAG: hypothetical protein A3H30_06960 [Alphaproteobacteria bacterium RIFCSPLOWO2_02_FULL_40_19]OFX10741.1 MAG: hypothetical protein A3G22_06510 [Alphaproteobacteria bacterium RI